MKLFDGLENKGHDQLKKDGFTEKDITVTRTLDMRYTGQVHECTVEVDAFDITLESLKTLEEAFHARHEELCDGLNDTVPLKSVLLMSKAPSLVKIERPQRMKQAKGNGAESAKTGTREAVFSSADAKRDGNTDL